MNCCRFCKEYGDYESTVKYGTRHYAHHACFLNAGKDFGKLHEWQQQNFPYKLLYEFRSRVPAIDAMMKGSGA